MPPMCLRTRVVRTVTSPRLGALRPARFALPVSAIALALSAVRLLNQEHWAAVDHRVLRVGRSTWAGREQVDGENEEGAPHTSVTHEQVRVNKARSRMSLRWA